MKAAILISFLIAISSVTIFAQLSKDDIEELLLLQGESEGKALWKETENLYKQYQEAISYKPTELALSFTSSFGSGFAMGIHQSHTALYKNTEWLPEFMQNWMSQRYNSEGVYTTMAQTNKVFRAVDYVTDRMSFHNWKRFYGGNWFYAYLSHTFVKNLTAYFVRNRTKTGHW